MSALSASIDYEGLEEELRAALAADELYKLRNDAKLRAVEQGVPTYEHFRQMVNAAHLKALERNDVKAKIGAQWNPMINGYPSWRKSKRVSEEQQNVKGTSLEAREDFVQRWKTIEDYPERLTYMWHLRHLLRTRIFRVEIPAFFLGDFTNVCLHCATVMDDVTQIIELLNILSTCNRFDLTICFMTKDEQLVCKQLFQQLRLRERSQLVSLAAKYRIDQISFNIERNIS